MLPQQRAEEEEEEEEEGEEEEEEEEEEECAHIRCPHADALYIHIHVLGINVHANTRTVYSTSH